MPDFSKLINKLEVLPNTVKALSHDFRPDVDSKVKRIEYKALMMISIDERMPMGFYCEKLDLENGSFTYLADKLEKKGWIKREYIQGDRRKKVLVLTPEGTQISSEIRKQFNKHLENKLSALSSDEVKQLYETAEFLGKIIGKIEKV